LAELKIAISELKMKQIDTIMDDLLARHWTKSISGRLEKIMQHIMLFEWKEAVEQADLLSGSVSQPEA
jgi:hypothetical protein